MSEVKNVEIIQSSLGRWHPGDLAFIEHFEYFADFESSDSALKLTALFQRRDTVRGGWPCGEGDFYRVRLLFGRLRDLFIKDFGSTPKQITGFDIVDISDRGWENVKFQIEDYEQGEIGFVCNSVEILSVEKVKENFKKSHPWRLANRTRDAH